jgi:DNA-binding GntR family transcriptional regulator
MTARTATASDTQRSRIDWVHDQLRGKILEGELAPGMVISQAALARELGISRSPIREALRRLESEGLIEARHNQRVQIGELSVADMEEVYAARIVLEVLAVRVAIPQLQATDLGEMRDALNMMRVAARDRDHDASSIQHSRFHLVPLAKAGPRLTSQILQLDDHSRRYRRLYVTQVTTAWNVVIAQDEAILQATEARDLDTVVGRWAQHLASTVLSTIALIEPAHDPVHVRAALRDAGVQTGTARATAIGSTPAALPRADWEA